MIFEIRVILIPESYTTAHERFFYFYIKNNLKYACFQTVLSGQCLAFWCIYLF